MNNQDSCRRKFRNVLNRLSEANKFNKVDEANLEFNEFLDDLVDKEAEAFRGYDFNRSRLDEFFYGLLHANDKYKNIWVVIRKCLLLSHGQAEVERGFSVNKHTMEDNISNEGLVAKR